VGATAGVTAVAGAAGVATGAGGVPANVTVAWTDSGRNSRYAKFCASGGAFGACAWTIVGTSNVAATVTLPAPSGTSDASAVPAAPRMTLAVAPAFAPPITRWPEPVTARFTPVNGAPVTCRTVAVPAGVAITRPARP